MTGTVDFQQIRKDFPLLERDMRGQPIVFLDTAASAQKPAVVIEAIDRYYREQHANVHRGVYALSQEATDAYEQGRRSMQHFLNAEHEHEIIFVRGSTEAINLVAQTFGQAYLKAGDEILISAMEHHSNIVPWQMAAERVGAKVVVIPVLDNGALDMEAFYTLVNARTKFISLVHISNALGTINPVKKVIDYAHKRDIPVLIDGAQAAPHAQVDVQALDCDFYTLSGHKMFGPTGIGVLYGKESWLEKLPPYMGGGEMIETVSFEQTTYAGLPHKFEAGTPHIAGGVGIGIAAEYILQIGKDNIIAYEQELLDYATGQLRQIDGFQLIGDAPHKASVISFLLEGTHPYDVGALLDQQGIAVRTGHHCTQPLMERLGIPGTVRASLAFYNNHEDIDRLVVGVQRAAKMLR